MTNKPINRVSESDIVEFELYPDIRRYQTLSSKTAIYPGIGTPLGLNYCALKLNGESGEFAEHVGKAMRDDQLINPTIGEVQEDGRIFGNIIYNPLLSSRRDLLIKELGDVIWYWCALCRELDVDPIEVMSANLKKLADRTKRDKLQGSGDER